MNYTAKITQVPADVELILPIFGEITIVYEDIMNGGEAGTINYHDIVDGGYSGSDDHYIGVVWGGDASSFSDNDYSNTHSILFRHTATNREYELPCRLVEKNDFMMKLEVTFTELPPVGQYKIQLLQLFNPEPLYTGMMEIKDEREPLPDYEQENIIYQYQ